ncbi:hypothetical protein [Blastococcus colisei]|uniref:hypothetical protein n=1 Tax=Blastococcus colisei TaxID=1564162 RepID=UPI001152AE74|nr:hypothetical protein [Blastococcus colisei]
MAHELADVGWGVHPTAPRQSAIGAEFFDELAVMVDTFGRWTWERPPRASGVADRASQVRERFRSSGTCSIVEPLEELVALGLLDRSDDRGGVRR